MLKMSKYNIILLWGGEKKSTDSILRLNSYMNSNQISICILLGKEQKNKRNSKNKKIIKRYTKSESNKIDELNNTIKENKIKLKDYEAKLKDLSEKNKDLKDQVKKVTDKKDLYNINNYMKK
jgi:uncharacterized coiled-coil protein SlyX